MQAHLNTQDAMHLLDIAATLCQQIAHEHVEAECINWTLYCNSDTTEYICLQSSLGI